MRSLQSRVALAAAIVLLVFIAATSLALERAFYDSARGAHETRLLGQVYLLMAAAELVDSELVLPVLEEARLNQPGSGLYATVVDGTGAIAWRSPSMIGIDDPLTPALPPGQQRFVRHASGSGGDFLVKSFGVLWSIGPQSMPFTFSVAEDASALRDEVGGFRRSLTRWLAVMSILLLATLLLGLRWGLAPLRRVAQEVAAIEAGRQSRLTGRYPTELSTLTANLNALLAHAEAQQQRLSNALGDLAHSLKTPLAVLRGALDEPPEQTRTTLGDQISRMQRIVDYQLQRAHAGAGNRGLLTPPVAVRPLVERLTASLRKIYADKGVEVSIEIDKTLRFSGVEGDLFEVLGNLLDNAFKWCRRTVCVSAKGASGSLVLIVDDDGPGIPAADAERLLTRGGHADEGPAGQGIGLAVVREICTAYGGTIEIDVATLGGASIRVSFRV